MATLNVRIEDKTKKEAAKTLAALGMDLSTGIKIFLNQVVIDQGLPFKPTKNLALLRAKWDKESAWALKNAKRYTSAKEILKDLGVE